MKLYTKILKIRGELLKTDIPKSGRNPHKRFQYYELEDIIPLIHKLCLEEKIFLKHEIEGSHAKLTAVNIEDTAETIVTKIPIPNIMAPLRETSKVAFLERMQDIGACQTYTKRYLYLNLFDIVDADSIDNKKEVIDTKPINQVIRDVTPKNIPETNTLIGDEDLEVVEELYNEEIRDYIGKVADKIQKKPSVGDIMFALVQSNNYDKTTLSKIRQLLDSKTEFYGLK